MRKLIEQIEAALTRADEIGATATALWLDRARWAITEDLQRSSDLPVRKPERDELFH